MNRPHYLPVIVGALLTLGLWAPAAIGQVCFYGDFDTDGSPWTIRTECPTDSCYVDFILEVPENPPAGEWFGAAMEEGCCNFPAYDGHYGTRVGPLVPNPLFVDSYSEAYPTCTFCCAWRIEAHFRADAQMVPGERYVILRGPAVAICDQHWPGCDPPHYFTAHFGLEGGSQCGSNDIPMGLNCETAAVPSTAAGSEVRMLSAPSPNPGSVAVPLEFTVTLSVAGHAFIALYNVAGRLEEVIADRDLQAGANHLNWKPARGGLADGVYFLRIEASGSRDGRMVIWKR
jgi:hypothetical protein